MNWYFRAISVVIGLSLAVGISMVAFADGGTRYQLLAIRGRTFSLEVAATPEQRTRGLRGRSSLAPDGGLLVRLEKPQQLSYSTRYTPFPIDVAYFDEQGVVVKLDRLAAEDSRLTASTSDGPVWGAVLLRGGTASMLQVVPGYRFEFGEARRRTASDDG